MTSVRRQSGQASKETMRRSWFAETISVSTLALDADYGVSFGDEGDALTHSGKLRVKVPLQWDADEAPLK